MEVGTSQFESGESYLLIQMRFFLSNNFRHGCLLNAITYVLGS